MLYYICKEEIKKTSLQVDIRGDSTILVSSVKLGKQGSKD